jgi:hypothetical protein
MTHDHHDHHHDDHALAWKHDGVRVIPGNQLDGNVPSTPGMDRKAAHGLFGRNPKGMGWKQRHSSLHS